MTTERTPTIWAADEGHWLAWLGHPIRYLATGDDTDGKYAMSWATVPVGEGPPPHRHDFEEGFYVVKGEITFTAGNQSIELTAGGFINIRSGTAHYLKNTGTQDAEVVVVVAPSGFDHFQIEGGTSLAGPHAIGETVSPTDWEYLKKIAPKYGIDLNPSPESFDTDPNITVRHADEGMLIAAVGDLYRFIAVTEETNGHYALWEAKVFPGGGPPPHVHHREEEGFFLLEGELTFHVGDRRTVAKAGAFANMPVGIEHAFKNEGETPARMLILVAPGGLEKMFERTGQVLLNVSQRIGPPSHEELERVLKIAPEYGIEMRIPESGHELDHA